MSRYTEEPAIYIGVDPGHASGGVCVLVGDSVWWCKAPTVDNAIGFQNELDRYVNTTHPNSWRRSPAVAIEQVSGRHSDGGSRAFNFGMGFGVLLQSFRERYDDIGLYLPRKWQTHFSLYGMKDAKGNKLNSTDKKNRHKDCAKQLLREDQYDIEPDAIRRLAHWKTDSYLIAQYLKDMREPC